MGTIVVGVDGSEGGALALQWALSEAQVRQWELEAVLAWGFLDQHHLGIAQSFDPGYSEADAAAALDGYVDDALGGAGAGVQRTVVDDLPAHALLNAAKGADLLVVGARGLGGFKGLLIGSVSQRCLHETPCPVAVIREPVPRPAEQPPRVVVGVDGSSSARPALAWAVDEARARGVVLQVVHAWQPPYVAGFPFTGVLPDYQAYEAGAHELVADLLASVDLTGVPEVERTAACSGPATALLDASRSADLTVVGARGLGGVQRFLLGSVSHQVTLHATHPVVVVPQ